MICWSTHHSLIAFDYDLEYKISLQSVLLRAYRENDG